MLLEKNGMENILCTLDKEGHIFPGFEIVKENDKPKLLGMGGFSSVYEMRSNDRPNLKYVLKVIGFEKHVLTSDNFWNTVNLQKFLAEKTPYICRLLLAKELCIMLDEDDNIQSVLQPQGERWTEDGIHLQFILMEGLEEIISRDRFGKVCLLRENLVNEEGVIEFALQIGQALHYAHSNNILHRDIKLENIFWDENEQCYKLGDFGIAKYVEEGNAETIVYTDGYGAPEIERCLDTSYNATADIYSFGITLYLLLNNIKFPGSEGHYVNLVQYSPDFVFPAPESASIEMTRIIRKMCEYYKEDRYQSVAEVLMDLSALKNRKRVQENEEEEILDFETETYKEAKHSSSRVRRENRRLTQKENERIDNEIYMKDSIGNFIGLTVLIALLIRGLQVDINIIHSWQLIVLIAMVFLETILLRVKEFHILFGAITLITGIYLGITAGLGVPCVILLLGVITGVPVVSLACTSATTLWILLMTSQKMMWLDFLQDWDLSWILVALVLVVLRQYICIRVMYEKASYVEEKFWEFFDMLYLGMVVVGIILLVLEWCGVIQIPEILDRIHLVRSGITAFVVCCVGIILHDCYEDYYSQNY